MRNVLLSVLALVAFSLPARAANNYIPIDTSATSQEIQTRFRDTLNRLQRAKQEVAMFKATLDQMTDGVSYTTIEATFGVPTGKGDDLYNLVAGAQAQLAGTSVANDQSLNNLLGYFAAMN